MAAPLQNRLDVRSKLLAQRMQQAVNVSAQALTPNGQPPPFTTRMPRNQALDWWLDNWSKPYAQQTIAAMPQQQQLELNVALSQHIAQKQAQQVQPQPWQADSVLGASDPQDQSNPLAAQLTPQGVP